MAYGRDIVIRLPDASSITEEDVCQSLANFVTVLSVTAAPSDASTLHARLLSSTHVDHLLNVLSGRLRVGGFLCGFARPSDDDSDEDDETLVEDLHGSFHDAFLLSSPTPTKSAPISIPMLDQSSVFLTPPQSLSASSEELAGGWPPLLLSPARSGAGDVASSLMLASPAASPTTIPIGLHPEIAVLDPSPERPENRAPRRRVAELAEIYDRCSDLQQPLPQLQPDYESEAFLPLAPPYHLLPNTPYFRNAPIEPPPLKPIVPPPTAQRIINRYLNSMRVMDNLDEMEIQSLMCFNFNRTVGYCPYTMPEKAPLQLGVPADRDDIIDEDWSIWGATNDDHQKQEEPALDTPHE